MWISLFCCVHIHKLHTLCISVMHLICSWRSIAVILWKTRPSLTWSLAGQEVFIAQDVSVWRYPGLTSRQSNPHQAQQMPVSKEPEIHLVKNQTPTTRAPSTSSWLYQARDIDPMLAWCWASVVDGVPAAPLHRINVSCLRMAPFLTFIQTRFHKIKKQNVFGEHLAGAVHQQLVNIILKIP